MLHGSRSSSTLPLMTLNWEVKKMMNTTLPIYEVESRFDGHSSAC